MVDSIVHRCIDHLSECQFLLRCRHFIVPPRPHTRRFAIMKRGTEQLGVEGGAIRIALVGDYDERSLPTKQFHRPWASQLRSMVWWCGLNGCRPPVSARVTLWWASMAYGASLPAPTLIWMAR